MKILVPIKQVVDCNTQIVIKPDKSGIDKTNIKMSLNPFDEIAIEEAVRLRESGIADEIIAVSCGTFKCHEILRTALAMCVDRAIHINTCNLVLEPLIVAKLIYSLIKKILVKLIMLGKQSSDNNSNQTGQMLAALLDWPQATFISKLEIKNDYAYVTREVDDGNETLLLKLPAVVTVDLKLNEPRYITLPNIIKSRNKSIEIFSLSDLDININNLVPKLNLVKMHLAPERSASGVIIQDIKTLLSKIKIKTKLI